MANGAVQITGDAFEKEIVPAKKTCLLVFTKEGCKVCARLAPTMERLADEYADRDDIDIYTLNVFEPSSKALFKSWALVGVPQTALIREGVFQEALPGALNEEILRHEIERLVQPRRSLLDRLKALWKS